MEAREASETHEQAAENERKKSAPRNCPHRATFEESHSRKEKKFRNRFRVDFPRPEYVITGKSNLWQRGALPVR